MPAIVQPSVEKKAVRELTRLRATGRTKAAGLNHCHGCHRCHSCNSARNEK